MLDLLLSLPDAEILEAGYLGLDGLTERLTEALADEFQRSEILQLRGDNAVLVINCLDKVRVVWSCSWCLALTAL